MVVRPSRCRSALKRAWGRWPLASGGRQAGGARWHQRRGGLHGKMTSSSSEGAEHAYFFLCLASTIGRQRGMPCRRSSQSSPAPRPRGLPLRWRLAPCRLRVDARLGHWLQPPLPHCEPPIAGSEPGPRMNAARQPGSPDRAGPGISRRTSRRTCPKNHLNTHRKSTQHALDLRPPCAPTPLKRPNSHED
jgi:hypothetical protein